MARNVVADVATGVGLIGRGLGLVLRRRKLFWLGAIPPAITSLLLIGVIIAMAFFADDVATWLTPFADRWAEWGPVLRIGLAVVLLAATLLVSVLTFSALTLALGGPVYDAISEAVDAGLGGVPGQPRRTRLVADASRGVAQALATVAQSLGASVALALLGLIPVVGTITAAVLGLIVGGFLLARELVGPPTERRGVLTLRERAALLRSRPWLALGFGVPVLWLLTIPLVSIVVFPAATAGATLLVRLLRDEPSRPVPSGT